MRLTVKSPPSVMVPACAAGDDKTEMAIVHTPKGFDVQHQSAIPQSRSIAIQTFDSTARPSLKRLSHRRPVFRVGKILHRHFPTRLVGAGPEFIASGSLRMCAVSVSTRSKPFTNHAMFESSSMRHLTLATTDRRVEFFLATNGRDEVREVTRRSWSRRRRRSPVEVSCPVRNVSICLPFQSKTS